MPNWCKNVVRIPTRPDPHSDTGKLIKRIKEIVGRHEEVDDFFKDLLEDDRELNLGSSDDLSWVSTKEHPGYWLLCYESTWVPHLLGWALVSAKYGVDLRVHYQEEDQACPGVAFCTPEKMRVYPDLIALDLSQVFDHEYNLKHCYELTQEEIRNSSSKEEE